jgi:hypothetical protein
LPDGVFSYQKSYFGYILLGMGAAGVFCTHWVYFMVIAVGCILWSLGTYLHFLVSFTKKNLATREQPVPNQLDKSLRKNLPS